jgi:hypothetical protein
MGFTRPSAPMRSSVASKSAEVLAMPLVRFTGTLYPTPIQISSAGGPTTHWNDQKLGLNATIDLKIENNAVEFRCEINQADRSSVHHLIGQVQIVADVFSSLFSFKTGYSFLLHIEKVHLPDGAIEDVLWFAPQFEKLATVVDSSEGMAKAINLLVRDRELSLAVRDITDCIRGTYTANLNLARSLESIRNYFVPTGDDRSEGWIPMRAALNISEARTRSITAASRDARHGRRTTGNGNVAEINGTKMWELMNRFIEYRNRGDQPLPLSEFPLLD